MPAFYAYLLGVTLAALWCEWTGRQHRTETVMGVGVGIALVWLLALAVTT